MKDLFFFREKLKGENALLLQSSCVAQETLDTQRELLEQISERLQQELNTAQKKEEVIKKDLEDSKNVFCMDSVAARTKTSSIVCPVVFHCY